MTIEDVKRLYPDLVKELENEVRREVEPELLDRLRRLFDPGPED